MIMSTYNRHLSARITDVLLTYITASNQRVSSDIGLTHAHAHVSIQYKRLMVWSTHIASDCDLVDRQLSVTMSIATRLCGLHLCCQQRTSIFDKYIVVMVANEN